MMDVVGDGGNFLGLFGVIGNGASDSDFEDLPARREEFDEVILSRSFRNVPDKNSPLIICRVLRNRRTHEVKPTIQ